ncbi:MAG: hypothetical protein AAB815_02005, partial [Patescibacteria group bacterium]
GCGSSEDEPRPTSLTKVVLPKPPGCAVSCETLHTLGTVDVGRVIRACPHVSRRTSALVLVSSPAQRQHCVRGCSMTPQWTHLLIVCALS